MRLKDTEISYHIVNLAFSIVIAMVFAYSLAFRHDNHPVPALLTEKTGFIPPSKGLSASFSEIVRGNFDTAKIYNPYGIRVFSFFALQFLLRVLVSILVKLSVFKLSKTVIIDAFVSILLFLWCFAPFIVYTFKLYFAH